MVPVEREIAPREGPLGAATEPFAVVLASTAAVAGDVISTARTPRSEEASLFMWEGGV